MPEQTLDPRRHIPLGSIQNLRDLGGYSTTDGGTTRWKTFLRSAGMSALTNADRQQMLDYEIGSVVDLRSLQDIKNTPNPFADLDAVAYHHLDLWFLAIHQISDLHGHKIFQNKVRMVQYHPSTKNYLTLVFLLFYLH